MFLTVAVFHFLYPNQSCNVFHHVDLVGITGQPCPYCHFRVNRVYVSEGLLDYSSEVPTQTALNKANKQKIFARVPRRQGCGWDG